MLHFIKKNILELVFIPLSFVIILKGYIIDFIYTGNFLIVLFSWSVLAIFISLKEMDNIFKDYIKDKNLGSKLNLIVQIVVISIVIITSIFLFGN